MRFLSGQIVYLSSRVILLNGDCISYMFYTCRGTTNVKILKHDNCCFNDNCSVISVYIDAGVGNTNPVTLNFVTSGPSFPRNWKVKICQIPCNTIYRGKQQF
jgi:hypothetical protein